MLHLLSNEVIRMQQVSVPYLNVECGALSSVHPQVKLLFPVWVEGACHNLLKRGIELNKKKPTYHLLLFHTFPLKVSICCVLYMMSLGIYLASSLLSTKFELAIWVTETCWMRHGLL